MWSSPGNSTRPSKSCKPHYYDVFERWGEPVAEGSWEARLHRDLEVHEGDDVAVKRSYDAFSGTDLEGISSRP